MRRLNKSVVAGGVVYPAGASGAEVEAAVRNPAHWDGDPVEVPEGTAPGPETSAEEPANATDPATTADDTSEASSPAPENVDAEAPAKTRRTRKAPAKAKES